MSENPLGYAENATVFRQGVVRLAKTGDETLSNSQRIAVTPAGLAEALTGGGTEGSFSTLETTGDATIGGDVIMDTIGTGLQVAEGSNAKQGVATLVAGTVVVGNTSVTANSRIFLTAQSLGTVTVPSALGVSARVAGTSFTILSSEVTDTSVVAYQIFEPA